MFKIRSQVLGSDSAHGLGPNKYADTLRHQVESNPTFQQALELTRSVLEPRLPDSPKAFTNVPASMEKAVVKLTNQVFSSELKKTIKAVNKFAAKFGDFGKEAVAELSKMDADDLKRHLFVGTVAVATSLSPSLASAAENPANLAI